MGQKVHIKELKGVMQRSLLMNEMNYKGYVIEAIPEQLVVTGRWRVKFCIWRRRGHASTQRQFGAGNTYPTEREAVAHCFNFGKQIIDGQMEGYSAADL
jgi:hypothetical protein